MAPVFGTGAMVAFFLDAFTFVFLNLDTMGLATVVAMAEAGIIP